MLMKVYLNVDAGLGIIGESPHVLEDVSGGGFARKFSLFWSLGTPCVRTEDLRGLDTMASGL
jgi:hypothetical protein